MNKIFKFALAALPMVMLASCAKDDLGLENDIAQETETRYLQVTLSSANGSPDTRAEGDPTIPDIEGNGTYTTGTADENKIKTLEFYFYDSNKNYHSYRSMDLDLEEQDSDGSTDIDPDPVSGSDKPNVSGFFHCNVPVELIQGSAMPRYVLCIINSVEGTSYVNNTLEDAQKKVLSDIYGSQKTTITIQNEDGSTTTTEKKYFGMSNSVYYGMDEVTSKDDQLIMATPFPASALKTETELNKMNDKEKEAAAVHIYVERYAAKVNLDLGGSEANKTPIKDYVAGGNGETTVALRFEPKGWRVNGTEKKFFFLKAYRTIEASTIVPEDGESTGTYGNTFETQAEMDKILFKGWNNEAHHRSFWARTPGYYSNNYPIVSDDMSNGDGTFNRDKYDVNYYTYNECTPFTGKYAYSEYVMETTMMLNRLTGEGMGDQYLPTAAVPSVIMVGQYKVVGAADDAEPIDLYAFGKQNVVMEDGTTESRADFYTGETDKEAGKALGLSSIKDKMLDQQTIILQKTTEADGKVSYAAYNSSTVRTLADKFAIEHPSAAVRMAPTTEISGENSGGGIKVAADIVVLQVKNFTADDNLYFYNAATSRYEQISEANVNTANRLLLQNLGGAHYYKDGMAFFFAPIQHWGWYRTAANDPRGANPNLNKDMIEWNWAQMKTGDFGIVRNHDYTLKIGEISGLGTAIKDPDEPIVPPADKVSYMVHFHVNIQRWAVLPAQEWNW